jgi:serine/threonine-protein kinase
MSLQPGTTLGPYSVTAKIGEGGMGEVYRARDTKLDRDVALKVLPQAFTEDPDRLARFEREAKVLASLNHPNIAAIHGLEESDGVRALVLELVEGPTLADRIAQGPIPIDEALPIAKQIAEALEAAHEAGVIHRDLKPANIKVKDDGTVKVLDFGLAKALEGDTGSDPSESPTLTAAATQLGVIMGTAAYMSPEQARGESVDKRADIWAFGCVVYEMLSGRRSFEGRTVSDTLASVLKTEPDWKVLSGDVPASVRKLLRRSLNRDRKERLQHIGDARVEIKEALTAAASDETVVTPGAQPAGWRQALPWSLGTLVVGSVVTGLAVWSVTGPPAPVPRVARFAIPPPAPETVGVPGSSSMLAISPDGTKVVYAASGGSPYQLYVRDLGALTATPLQGLDTPVFSPFFSPDGALVGFDDVSDNTLKRISIFGGPAVTICSTGAGIVLGASWGEDDTIIFGTNLPSGLWRVPYGGGEPEEITSPDVGQAGVNHAWPHILPGGRAVLFTIQTEGDIENAQIALLDLDTGHQRVLVQGGSHPRYSSTGHIVYGVSGTLRAVAFDVDRLEVTGLSPVLVLEGVATRASGAVEFDLASDGSLVYVSGSVAPSGNNVPVWIDHEGTEVPLDIPERYYASPRLSPDESRLAVTIQGENTDVWVSEVARGALTPLTDHPAIDTNPVWTPDGERIVFFSRRGGSSGLFRVSADGTGEVEHLITIDETNVVLPYASSADGSRLVFEYGSLDETGRNIGVLLLDDEPTWEPLLDTNADEFSPAISPDGNWVAYASDETGQPEVYAQRFPELGGKVSISAGLGIHPLWAPDSRSVYFVDPDGMQVVPVELDSSLRVGGAEVLFPVVGYVVAPLRNHDLSPDGQRFLMLKEDAATTSDGDGAPDVILVQNWTEELKERVPIP